MPKLPTFQTMADEWIHEGMLKERGDMVLRVLQRRFQLTEERLLALRQQLSQIEDGESLSKLVDLSLDVLVLPDFIARLQTFLPRTIAQS